MGEAKKRKAIDDMYGVGKLAIADRPFILAMQEAAELQTSMGGDETRTRNEHQLFLDGVLNGESGVYAIGIPVELVDFDEYAFTASINALIGFLGVTRFGMVMHSHKLIKENIDSVHDTERDSVIMMLACVNGVWFYNMINSGQTGGASIPVSGDWRQGKIDELATSDKSKRFMMTVAETLKKSRTLQNDVKATMTLKYLKEHYRAVVSAPKKRHVSGEVPIS